MKIIDIFEDINFMREELNPPENLESVFNQDSQVNEYEYLVNKLRNIKTNISLLEENFLSK